MKPEKWARIKARERMKKHGEPYDMALKKARTMIRRHHQSMATVLSSLALFLTAFNAWSVL